MDNTGRIAIVVDDGKGNIYHFFKIGAKVRCVGGNSFEGESKTHGMLTQQILDDKEFKWLKDVVMQSDNEIFVNGKSIPLEDGVVGNNTTIIDGRVFVDGKEYKNGTWKKTLRAMWHKFF